MYNVGISLALSVVAFALTSIFLPPIAGVLPGIAVFGLTFFLISRRVGAAVEAEMASLVPLLQGRKIVEAKAQIEKIKGEWGPWQPMLTGQLDAQLGMIDYLQMKWDDALPALERGKWRNWIPMVCVGLIHYRKRRHDQADQMLSDAAWVAPKEPMVYVVRAIILHRTGATEKALQVLADALKTLEGNELLTDLRGTIANKKKIDVTAFPETWFQFFPEDVLKMQNMRGRRTGNAGPMPGVGFQQGKVSRKMRRGR